MNNKASCSEKINNNTCKETPWHSLKNEEYQEKQTVIIFVLLGRFFRRD
jgi:hypothetical protein